MCCHGDEEYEYIIEGKVDTSVFDLNPDDVKKMPRAERFKVYSRLYHLFNHVSQEIWTYFNMHDWDHPQIKIFQDELPDVNHDSKVMEENLFNYGVSSTELDQLKEDLDNLDRNLNGQKSYISSDEKEIQAQAERLEYYKKRQIENMKELQELTEKRLNLINKIKEKTEEKTKEE